MMVSSANNFILLGWGDHLHTAGRPQDVSRLDVSQMIEPFQLTSNLCDCH